MPVAVANHPVVAALRRVYQLPLLVHIGVLVIMVALAVPHLNLATTASVDDEGSYAIQVQELREGHWRYDYAGTDFDPEGRWFAVARATQAEDRFYPYIQHPVYVLILAGSVSLFGEGVGFFLPPIVGLLLAAVAAWLLAARIEARAARPAFWLVAVSPLVVNAFVLWAHTLSAALAGFAVLCAVVVLRDSSSPWAKFGLAACLAGGVLLRSEAILFAIAVTLVVTGTLVGREHYRHAALTGVICAAAIVLAVFGEAAIIRAITGGWGLETLAFRGEPTSPESSFWVERWDGLWRIVFRSSTTTGVSGAPVTIALMLLALAGVGFRVGAHFRAGTGFRGRMSVTLLTVLAIAAALVLYEIRFAATTYQWLSGEFAAWPVVLLGLVAVPWRRTTVPERVLLVSVVLFAGAVALTQYSTGGGAEWGGRFLSPTVVPLAVVAGAGLTRRLTDHPWTRRGILAVALVVLAVVPAAHGVLDTRGFRGRDWHFYRSLRDEAREVIVVDASMWMEIKGEWPLHPRFTWYLTQTDADTNELFAELTEHGVDGVSLLSRGRLYQAGLEQ